MTALLKKYYRVYTKSGWDRNPSTWVRQKYWQPITAQLCTGLAQGSATLLKMYGSGTWEDATAMTDGSALAASGGVFVRITVCNNDAGAGEQVLFVGIIPAEQFDLLGQTAGGTKTADQVLTAYTLDWLWSRPIRAALVTDGTSVSRIGWSPAFNARTRSGGVLGNKGVSFNFDGGDGGAVPAGLQDGVASAVFDADPSSAGLWDAADVIAYLMHFVPLGMMTTVSYSANIGLTLAMMTPVLDPSGKSVRAVLNELCGPSRGLCWALIVGADDSVTLKIYSLLESDVTVGAVVIFAHDAADVTAMNLWTDDVKTSVQIARDTAGLYDAIEVVGAPICACGTFSIDDETLEAAWTAAQETQYKAGVSGSRAGYADLSLEEKAYFNDIFRGGDGMGSVYQHFELAWMWDWIVNNHGGAAQNMNPAWDPVTMTIDAGTQANYWNGQNRFLPYLPLKEGYDYTGAAPVNNNTATVDPDWRRILVLGQKADGSWVQVDRMRPRTATVQVMDDRAGVIVRGNPPHLLGRNSFDDRGDAPNAEPSAFDEMDSAGIDYDTLIVTAMVQTDQLLSVRYETGRNTGRELVIELPEASLWWTVTGTVTGIAADGTLERFACTDRAVRNDTEVLAGVLAAAAAFYGAPRYRATIAHQQITMIGAVGTMITGIDVDGAGTRGACISSLSWDFTAGTTTVTTDFAELDFRSLAALGPSAGVPRKIDRAAYVRLQNDVFEMKKDLAAARPAGAVTDQKAVRMAVIRSGLTGKTFTANLYDFKGVEQTAGSESQVTVECAESLLEYVAEKAECAVLHHDGRWWCFQIWHQRLSSISSSSIWHSSSSSIRSTQSSATLTSKSSSSSVRSTQSSATLTSESSGSSGSEKSGSSGSSASKLSGSSGSSASEKSQSSGSSGQSSRSSASEKSQSSGSSGQSSRSSASEKSGSSGSSRSKKSKSSSSSGTPGSSSVSPSSYSSAVTSSSSAVSSSSSSRAAESSSSSSRADEPIVPEYIEVFCEWYSATECANDTYIWITDTVYLTNTAGWAIGYQCCGIYPIYMGYCRFTVLGAADNGADGNNSGSPVSC